MSQFKDCRTTEFLFSLDNRLSDTAFLTGMVANLATQVGTLGLYYFLSKYQGLTAFDTLYQKHSMVKAYTDFTTTAVNINTWVVDYRLVGK